MELSLRYQKNMDQPIAGVYLHGNVTDWFAEISCWSINVLSLQVYFVPESIAKNDCAGIFITFAGDIPKSGLLRNPYTMVSDGFYIPSNAQLFPPVDAIEIQKIKLWDIQFFHPSIGLVGFETSDAKPLSELIALPLLIKRDWQTVWPEVQIQPQITMIAVLQPGDLDVVGELMALVDHKPLSDIPNSEEQDANSFSTASRLLKPLKTMGIWLLLMFAFIGKFILMIIEFLRLRKAPAVHGFQKPGLLQRLNSWISKQMNFLEKQRDTELNRLVKMFDTDKDLALQYAIPLSSPHLERGTASPTGKLVRRSLNFNFNRFGTGTATDAWDIGNYRWELQNRYEKTAKEAISNGDYKRAAYVYAHLLGDFLRAANTLKDGKHFREAAAIFKDQLKNELRAAECLEQGGLLNEAIAIYIKLEQYETVGNLYDRLGQKENASKYFEEHIKKTLAAKDYFKASEIIASKLGDLERSQSVLLDGWHSNSKREQCLFKYFQIEAERGFSLAKAITEFKVAHVTRTKSTSFLQVLADHFASSKDPDFKDEALSICYQIVDEQARYGDFSALKTLGRFMPDDRMIEQDVHRYYIKHYKEVKLQQAQRSIQLDVALDWLNFCNFHDQLLGIAMDDTHLYLFRMNWDGNSEYSYLGNNEAETVPTLIADAGFSDDILLVSPQISTSEESLPITNDFQRSATLRQLNWIGFDAVGSTIDPNGNVTVVQVRKENLQINTHDLTGKLLTSCSINLDTYLGEDSQMTLRYSSLYWRKEHLYFINQFALLRADEDGILEVLPMGSHIRNLSVSAVHTAVKIAVLTENGCVIVAPTLAEMKIVIPLFGTALSANLVQLLPNNFVVIAADQKAQVYEVSGRKAKLLFEIVTDYDIESILPVPRRNQFALYTTDKQISLYVIPSAP